MGHTGTRNILPPQHSGIHRPHHCIHRQSPNTVIRSVYEHHWHDYMDEAQHIPKCTASRHSHRRNTVASTSPTTRSSTTLAVCRSPPLRLEHPTSPAQRHQERHRSHDRIRNNIPLFRSSKPTESARLESAQHRLLRRLDHVLHQPRQHPRQPATRCTTTLQCRTIKGSTSRRSKSQILHCPT